MNLEKVSFKQCLEFSKWTNGMTFLIRKIVPKIWKSYIKKIGRGGVFGFRLGENPCTGNLSWNRVVKKSVLKCIFLFKCHEYLVGTSALFKTLVLLLYYFILSQHANKRSHFLFIIPLGYFELPCRICIFYYIGQN